MASKSLIIWVAFLSCFTALATDELPPGVPKPLNPDGTHGDGIFFTTKAYQQEAFRLLIKEANLAAEQLSLPEHLPITESNIVGAFINPFGYAYANKALGKVTTSNYVYGITAGNKFSILAITHLDERCAEYAKDYRVPIARVDTNGAIRAAERWLTTIGVDVKALNSECNRGFNLDSYWNGTEPGARVTKKIVVPICQVYWESPRTNIDFVAATVTLFAPTETLLQLEACNPKYNLRPPVVVGNLAVILSETNNAPSQIEPRRPTNPQVMLSNSIWRQNSLMATNTSQMR